MKGSTGHQHLYSVNCPSISFIVSKYIFTNIFTCSDSCQVYGSILLCSICMSVCPYVCMFHQFSGLAQLSIMLHGYLDIMDIQTSWIFGHHGCTDIMDIWTPWIFGHHGYSDIMVIWTSWIFGHHGYSDIMDIWTSWIFKHHLYLDIMDSKIS